MHVRIGRYRLRVEIVQSDILLRMRSEMEAARQGLVGGENRIELRERVERLRRAETLGKRQGVDFLLVEEIFGAFEEIEVIGNDRSAQVKSGSRVAHPFKMTAANEKVGEWIIQTVIPFLAAVILKGCATRLPDLT